MTWEVWTTGDGMISVTVDEMLTPDDARAVANELLSCATHAEMEQEK